MAASGWVLDTEEWRQHRTGLGTLSEGSLDAGLGPDCARGSTLGLPVSSASVLFFWGLETFSTVVLSKLH